MVTLTAHTQETLRITDLDTFGDVRSTRRNKTVCCIFFVRSPICARRSREPSERGDDGNTNEVNDLHSFRGHAANAASSCSRAAVQQTSGDWLSTREIQRWRFCTSCCHRSRSPSFVHTHLQTKWRDTTGINHLRCRVCCARRLVTSQAFDLAYRQSTESVSSATLTVLGGRLESLPSDVEDLCLWI